jgi:uncharacterized protein (DUF1501 family)
MKRREFLQRGTASGIAVGSVISGGWVQSLATEVARSKKVLGRVLVVVQLSGGNDGLNTVVPHKHELYRKARPKLGIASEDIVALDDDLGLHPSLRTIEKLLESNRFSIVHGVGYEKPNRSHFESMDIWHSCNSKSTRNRSGWLGRMFAQSTLEDRSDAPGIHLGNEVLPLALIEKGIQVPSIASLDQFRWKGKPDASLLAGDPAHETMKRESSAPLEDREEDDGLLGFLSSSTEAALAASQRIESTLSKNVEDFDFPKTQLGEKLKTVARLILAGLQTSVYYVTLDGFDTHANQLAAHAGLLRQWSDALAAFHARLQRSGQADRVLAMTFSEFGRRVSENASQGTDHGAAAPMFFSGPVFPNLFVGEMPSLSDLDDGDLKYRIDFRSAYRSVIEDWFALSSDKILPKDFPKQKLFVD